MSSAQEDRSDSSTDENSASKKRKLNDSPDVQVIEKFELDPSMKAQLQQDYAAICDVTLEVAKKHLEQRDWDMQRAIDDFLAGASDEANDPTVSAVVPEPEVLNPTKWAPQTFSVLSWNVDGLDEKNLELRTQQVVETIEKDNFSVVFLQELRAHTFHFIATKLQKKYVPVLGTDDPSAEYFTATFLRKNHIIYTDHYIIPFPNSTMGRNLLVTKAFTGRAQLFFLNTHLESTAEFSAERISQLRICFDQCMSFPPEANVIFGGDLNLRDKEVVSVLPREMFDIWVHCGMRRTCEYTWDLTRNTNLQMPSKFQPRMRFDRLYCRLASPRTIQPDFFGITGLEKVPKTQSFPSDHWAIIAYFKLEDNARQPPEKQKQ